MPSLMIGPETRPKAIDYIDPREELYLDTPGKVRLHLQRPAIALEMDTESMLDPDLVALKLRQTHNNRYQLNGVCFDIAAQKGRRQSLWAGYLEEAAIGFNGKFSTLDGKSVGISEVLT